MQARITRGGETLFEGVRVSLLEGAGLNTLAGFVYLPPGAELGEGEYELRLEGGRSLTVLVFNVRDGIARFRGCEPAV